MGFSGRFTDRQDAGEKLATALHDRGIEADIVLAIPRGGLPLGRAVAERLDAPLDIVVAKKIGAPNNPEYATGAVASDGSVWRNESAFAHTDADDHYFEQQRQLEAKKAKEKLHRYRGDRPTADLQGKKVVVVDDGVATGSTLRACLAQVRASDPSEIVVAVPVGPPNTIAELEELADIVVCLQTPTNFRAVGQAYQQFGQVSDTEAMAYLDQ